MTQLDDRLALLNMAEVARRIGVSKVAVYQWLENGIPEARLREFSDVTDISVTQCKMIGKSNE